MVSRQSSFSNLHLLSICFANEYGRFLLQVKRQGRFADSCLSFACCEWASPLGFYVVVKKFSGEDFLYHSGYLKALLAVWRFCHSCIRVCDRKPMLWHPDTGEMEAVGYKIKDGETIVRLNLDENDAVFVVFSGVAEQKKVVVAKKEETLFRRIDTPWTVQFDEAWGGPEEATFDKLISYTESENQGIKYYSGTAVYKNSLRMTEPELKQGHLVLDLGKVGCMAEVMVNGQNLGVLWNLPYKVDITQVLKAGVNEFEIHVVNPWMNRVIGDLQPDCQKKYAFPAFTFYRPDAPLQPAGLMGPVEIKALR